MAEPAKREATYEDLFDISQNMTGEIIHGELVVTPRPSRRHVYTSSALGGKLMPPYQFGEGNGPGGWIIIIEPEIGLGRDILVPDLAGWKRERFPISEDHNWISVAPDWVCEVLSPGTAKTDKTDKMPIYAQYEIPYLWFIDPIAKTMDVFRLESGKWVVVGLFVESDKIRVAPFPEAEIDLGALWLV
jgi:Uma2 family endonuclease